jgi:hypothetical protein
MPIPRARPFGVSDAVFSAVWPCGRVAVSVRTGTCLLWRNNLKGVAPVGRALDAQDARTLHRSLSVRTAERVKFAVAVFVEDVLWKKE